METMVQIQYRRGYTGKPVMETRYLVADSNADAWTIVRRDILAQEGTWIIGGYVTSNPNNFVRVAS